MPRFQHGSVEIAFLDEGEGDPIILVHGFASTNEVNWLHPGWVATLTAAGRRVIALDNRGHGAVRKLYDPAAYHTVTMAEDVRRVDGPSGARARRRHGLLDGRAHHRVPGDAGILRAYAPPCWAASASTWSTAWACRTSIADALEAPSLAAVTDPVGRTFRAFAEQTRSDLEALAACIRGSRQTLGRDEAAAIEAPVLIAVGTEDKVAGSAARAGGSHAERAGARHPAAATTCWRSATRCSRPASCEFLERRA